MWLMAQGGNGACRYPHLVAGCWSHGWLPGYPVEREKRPLGFSSICRKLDYGSIHPAYCREPMHSAHRETQKTLHWDVGWKKSSEERKILPVPGAWQLTQGQGILHRHLKTASA